MFITVYTLLAVLASSANIACRPPITNVEVKNISLAGFTYIIFVGTVMTTYCFFDIANSHFKIKLIKKS